jgi:glycine hydroxymethyltransferase
MADFINTTPLEKIDLDVSTLIDIEKERQKRKLILIPSESSAPAAVLEGLGSPLQNLYAEGYPDEETRWYLESEILDYDSQLTHFRRYSDPRYYKGVEYADVIEELARRRCAELFSNDIYSTNQIFVNVQPLSGAPANNAVYQALIEPNDVILGMNLFHGGHLTHGSSVNRSGKLYKAVHYNVNPETGQIDYESLMQYAQETRPRIIIAGYSSYPWVPDWKAFRQIADSVKAYLLADISHIAGLVATGAVPSPVGYADVITFTTHKTLCGPRGACILSFNESVSKKIDKAVFPGEQGGPHVHAFAAMATTFKLAKTEPFIEFQHQILKNCQTLVNQLSCNGFRIAYGGSNTHLLNIDCKTVIGDDGAQLSGDMAARILDLAGIVVNANTIPGDKSAFLSSGIRIGTPWVTQRGLVEKDMVAIADIISEILKNIKPYYQDVSSKTSIRAKISFDVLESSKNNVKTVVANTKDHLEKPKYGYPHFYFQDDYDNANKDSIISFSLSGEKILQCLNYIIASDIEGIESGKTIPVIIHANKKPVTAELTTADYRSFILSVASDKAGLVSSWLRNLSDGFISFDDDPIMRIPGPFVVKEVSVGENKILSKGNPANSGDKKPYYIGLEKTKPVQELPVFQWAEQNNKELKRTSLYDWHVANGAKMVEFAGWEMPIWYSSVINEHLATRNAAGLFDVSHMGVYQAEGVEACSFLDSVCANDISNLEIGESCYTHFLDIDGKVIDDLLVYRHKELEYLVVVNAANDDKDWDWLNAVKNGTHQIDRKHPLAAAFGSGVMLRNLRDLKEGDEMRVDIALQGPKSREILLKLGFNKEDKAAILRLKRTQLCHAKWNSVDLILSRTGYTGEKMAFEIFVHPAKAPDLWESLMQAGTEIGLLPCGLGSRDSLRTEAGLPLYGHEMGGELNLGVAEAGFGSFVKVYKPWFIGRTAFLENEKTRTGEVIRFKFDDQRVRTAHLGDPVIDEKGKVIGKVTSCSIDKEGFWVGQAYVDKKYTSEGTVFYIYQNASKIEEITIKELNQGEKITLPNKAVVISRFARL